MAEHYYSSKPTTKHDEHKLEVTLRGHKFQFITDAGVFSKKGIDYGSRVLIEAMEIAPGSTVLDVGCGYGPMGLSAAVMSSNNHVTMLDINERAVELAKGNAQRNGIANVTVKQSDTLQEVLGQQYDVVLTNPPIRAGKDVVHRIFEEAHSVLRSGGSLWIVIQKKQGAPSAFSKLESLFGQVEEVTKDKGYRIIKAIK